MKSWKIIIKKSLYYSFAIVTGISTIASILGYSLKDLFKNHEIMKSSLTLIIAFLIVSSIIILIQFVLNHKGFTTIINGKEITIRNANIFTVPGLKVIPFNERFDTKVDDIVISHDSLNGIMIDNYVTNIDDLNNEIKLAFDEKVELAPIKKKNTIIYPLGRIIKYNDFLMLAMSHFDKQNQAYIHINEYESMLTNMWYEIRRVYAGKKIVIPLIGSGITTMTGIKEKNNTILLKCMLCTLKRSRFQPKNGITIVLTDEAMNSIEMVKIKEEFKSDI